MDSKPEYSSLPIPVSDNELAISGLQVDPYAEERAKYSSEARGHVYHTVVGLDGPVNTTQSLTGGEALLVQSNVVENSKHPNRRKWILIGTVALLLVVIGAVVGGVLGSRKATSSDNDKSDASPGGNTSSSTEPPATRTETQSLSSETPVPSSIAPNSLITATGWRLQGSTPNIHVVFHDSKGSLVYTRSDGNDYSRPQPLYSQYELQKQSPIAVTGLPQLYGGDWAAQLELFHLNASSCINGFSYNTGTAGNAAGFQPDSINRERYASIDGGSIAAYWPLILYQDIARNLMAVTWVGTEAVSWSSMSLNLRAKDQSKLAAVPITTNSTWFETGGWLGVLYQNDEGRLQPLAEFFDVDDGDTKKLSVLKQAWSAEKFPKIMLGSELSFAAFSVARAKADDPTDWVNTYILYQDESSDIKQVVLNDEDKGWQSSSPSALKKADKGTAIACITAPMWGTGTPLGEYRFELASDLNRCYFWKEGNLVEVVLEDGKWKGPKRLFTDS